MASSSSSDRWVQAPEAPHNSGQAAEPVSSKPISKIFHKTRLCRFEGMGICSKGTTCTFAHSKSELRQVPKFFRTKLCPDAVACSNRACKFAHSIGELRPVRLCQPSALRKDTVFPKRPPPPPSSQPGSMIVAAEAEEVVAQAGSSESGDPDTEPSSLETVAGCQGSVCASDRSSEDGLFQDDSTCDESAGMSRFASSSSEGATGLSCVSADEMLLDFTRSHTEGSAQVEQRSDMVLVVQNTFYHVKAARRGQRLKTHPGIIADTETEEEEIVVPDAAQQEPIGAKVPAWDADV